MALYVPFKQPRTGEVRTVKVGWSWVLFLWSGVFGLPLFLRRLNVWGAVFLALWAVNLVASFGFAGGGGARGLSLIAMIGLQIWLGIKGNEMTAKNYLEQGWEFAEPNAEATLEGKARWRISA
jgi:hypothetical protein